MRLVSWLYNQKCIIKEISIWLFGGVFKTSHKIQFPGLICLANTLIWLLSLGFLNKMRKCVFKLIVLLVKQILHQVDCTEVAVMYILCKHLFNKVIITSVFYHIVKN